jgi:predicted DNA-binding protein (UPF0251 family)
MAPKHKPRRIFLPPANKNFTAEKGKGKDSIVLRLDEYEAIRLLDYELMNQVDVAKLMEVSRPTLTRIYEQARRKVALAFVDGRDIEFSGGNVYTGKNWYSCSRCDVFFNSYDNVASCTICNKNDSVENVNDNL